jgi:hypothetical protein
LSKIGKVWIRLQLLLISAKWPVVKKNAAILDRTNRLHNKWNLMAEFGKLKKVIEKIVVTFPHHLT